MRFHRYLTQLFNSRRPNTRPLPSKRKSSRRLYLEALEDRTVPAIFLVTNTLDGGPGSLRSAMIDAENTPNVGGPDRIEFNIPGSGVHIIQPTTPSGKQQALPVIHDPVIIDGYTQPRNDGSGLLATPNNLPVGDNAVLQIEINGSLMTPGTHLFVFAGTNSTVRGLAVTHVQGTSFKFSEIGAFEPGNNNTVAGNFIGTDAGGLTYQGSDGPACYILAGSNNVIGGPDPTDRNVIAPGSFVPTASIGMGSGTGNLIQGNYIGVNKDGTAALQSPFGGFAIDIGAQSGSNTIAGNVIFATLTGIRLTQGTTGHNVIQGNFIGSNATGTAGLGSGQFGIDVQSSNETITGNVISGFSTGISISPQGSAALEPGATIQGNKIGTDITGTLAIPNSGHGIVLVSSPAGGTTIGGTHPGDGNTIAFNSGFGVFVNSGTGPCSILGNSIFNNGNLGINLNGSSDGFTGPVTPNDAGDVDSGPNGLQNYPVITSAISGGSSTIITGTLNSTPGASFRIEFFASDAADSSGFGEGQVFLGAITSNVTDGNGNVSFTATLPVALSVGQVVSATATDHFGNTSEFALTIAGQVNNTSPVIISLDGPTSGLTGQQLSYTGEFVDPDPDTWTGTVNYGDGSGDQQLNLNPDKTFAFNHTFSSPGTYTVTVTVADNHGGFDSDSLTVTVTTNTPPVITQFSGPAILRVGQTFIHEISFDDPDSDTWTGNVDFGDGTSTSLLFLNRQAVPTLKAYFSPGTYTAVITITDEHGASDTRSFTTTVVDNLPPVITQFSGPAILRVGQTFIHEISFDDPDSDTWTGNIDFGDGTSTSLLFLNRQAVPTLKAYFSPGTYTAVITITDEHGASDTRSFTTTVVDNLPPVAINDTALLNTAASKTINVLANDSDTDGDHLTVTAVTQPASGHGIVTINANGTLNYRQTVYANGTETFTYTINDGHGGTATANVTVRVNLPASVGIDMLIDQVRNAGLDQRRENSLETKLQKAKRELASGHIRSAANELADFARQVRVLRRIGILSVNMATLWLFEEANIVAALPPR